MTDEEKKAKNWDILMHRNTLRADGTRLQNELRQFAKSWDEMGKLCSRGDGWRFETTGEKWTIRNSQGEHLASAPWLHFDSERIRRLLDALEESRKALETAEREVRAIGAE